MGTAQVVVLALLFGLVVGAVFTVLLRSAADRGAMALELLQQHLPDGAEAVLQALDRPALIVDGSNTVLIGTPGADALGLISGRLVAHPELVALIDGARAAHAPRSGDFVLRRGTVGPPTLHLAARAAPVGVSSML
ncbi:MAG: two-component system, OmpR family, sensor histidine kinase SenX3, partial [Microbacteriaceae bacterium]|nr:two-component system, OmpR family, sensor histidine kinase SenX3 [Microbacteriaceae bacterium]